MIGHQITQEFAAAVISRVVTQWVGRAGILSTEATSDQIDTPVDTIASHRRGAATPGFCTFLRYCKLFGAPFINAVLAYIGFGGVVPLVAMANPNGFRAVGSLGAALSDLGRRLEDGRLCHRDRAALAPVMRQLSAELGAFAQALQAPNVGAALDPAVPTDRSVAPQAAE